MVTVAIKKNRLVRWLRVKGVVHSRILDSGAFEATCVLVVAIWDTASDPKGNLVNVDIAAEPNPKLCEMDAWVNNVFVSLYPSPNTAVKAAMAIAAFFKDVLKFSKDGF